FAGKDGPRRIAAGGIAHARGVIADDDDRLVAPFLELADDAHGDGMTERDVRRRRVHAHLDAQRLADGLGLGEFSPQVFFGEDAGAARDPIHKALALAEASGPARPRQEARPPAEVVAAGAA